MATLRSADLDGFWQNHELLDRMHAEGEHIVRDRQETLTRISELENLRSARSAHTAPAPAHPSSAWLWTSTSGR